MGTYPTILALAAPCSSAPQVLSVTLQPSNAATQLLRRSYHPSTGAIRLQMEIRIPIRPSPSSMPETYRLPEMGIDEGSCMHAIDRPGHLCGMQCVLHQVSILIFEGATSMWSTGPSIDTQYPQLPVLLGKMICSPTTLVCSCLYDHELRLDIPGNLRSRRLFVVPVLELSPVVDCPDNIRSPGTAAFPA